MAKVIVMTSGKGGVGKTTSSAAFATGLALRGFKTVVIDFQVEQEDTVYPMVPAGADLDAMIRRPSPSPIIETGADA